MNVLEKFSKFLNELNLFLIPLYFIKNKECSCGKGSACPSPGKHPRSTTWKEQSQEKYEKERISGLVNHKDNDKNVLKYLYDCLLGNCNLAITTGKYSKENKKYLIVVDIDLAKTEEGTVVRKNLDKLCDNLFEKTFYYKTGSGGYHFWFWSDKLLKNSVGKFYKNIDIRGENGYVVIPPSNHITGGEYEIISEKSFNNGISDIKHFYDEISNITKTKSELLLSDKTNNLIETTEDCAKITDEIRSGLLNKGATKDQIAYWTGRDLKQIKNDLKTKKKLIPVGIRNSTIYRLLSSDHHLGATKNDLKNNSVLYLHSCEDMHTVAHEEINAMIDRISRYKTFRNDRDVNYDFYLMTQKTSIHPFTQHDYEMMVKLDNHFFDSLEVSDEPSKISDLIETRNKNMKFFTKRFSVYNQACFAHQLKKRGFIKTRKGGKCTWNVKFNFNKFIYKNPFLETEIKPKNTKPVSKECFNSFVFKEKKFNEIRNDDNIFKLDFCLESPRILNMTIQVKEVTLKIKNKKHPSAARYPGRANYELNKTFLPFFTDLSPEDIEKFESFNLFIDETESREEFATVMVGDKIGFVAKYDNGMVSSIGEVLEIKPDIFVLKDIYNNQEIDLTFAEASVGRHIGYFEILYRNDKPYGIPEEEEVKVNVEWDDPDAEKQTEDGVDSTKENTDNDSV